MAFLAMDRLSDPLPQSLGHNGGPSLSGGKGWKTHCWKVAREQLLPHLPVEVVRLRVRRAAELGLDYKTYAGVRATTGRDLVAFLFSSNAFDLRQPGLLSTYGEKIGRITRADRVGLVHRPVTTGEMQAAVPQLDMVFDAPPLLGAQSAIRERLRAALGPLPSASVLLIGSYDLEKDWCAAGRLAGYLPAERYFGMG